MPEENRFQELCAGIRFLGMLILLVAVSGCVGPQSAVLEGDGIRVEFDSRLRSQIGVSQSAPAIAESGTTEFLLGVDPSSAEVILLEAEESAIEDQFGPGQRLFLSAMGGLLRKDVSVHVYNDFPGFAVFQVTYTNVGSESLAAEGWVNHAYRIPVPVDQKSDPPFWSYNGASYEDRRDWLQPVTAGFAQDNNLGMVASDYGGGTPVVDIWSPQAGLAVGHLEPVPRELLMPLRMPDAAAAEVSIREDRAIRLAPGESFSTPRTFVSVHRGDYFVTLRQYSRMMQRQGLRFGPYPESAYEPAWCAWGYERDFVPAQVIGTLPKVKELGFQWAVLDDGWQTSEGDWYLHPRKFPKGDADMRRLTDAIRKAGLKPGLWWAPMAVDPGTNLLEEHPEFLLLNQEGKPQPISWWDAYYLCPAYTPVREREKALLRKIMEVWGFDGLKLDGQFLNAVPPCFNPAHKHARPEESVEAMPLFLKDLYNTAVSLKADAVMQLCPCGTAYSVFSMPYMNQPVSSDPLSSWQIRHKGKTFKALMGSEVPYYGDHVELSDGGDDFATTVGIGGVPGSKFTWPVGSKPGSRIDLTPAREQVWSHWIRIYLDKMLSKGDYLGELYDIGFDRPETHAIAKGNALYYAYFASEFQGEVELRGLKEQKYRVSDYVNGKDLGVVTGPSARIPVQFERSLLIEAVPD